MKVGIVATVVFLAGCQQPQPRNNDEQFGRLNLKILDVQRRLDVLEEDRKARQDQDHGPAAARYDLVVSWPNGGATDHSPYPDRASCETARAVVLMDNKRRTDQANEQVGQVLDGGARVVAVGRVATPTALCIPG